MNTYGNEFGYHNPKKSKKIFKTIAKALPTLKFDDSSWHNDEVDSIWCEEYQFQVFFREHNMFTILNEEQEIIGNINIKSVEDVIKTIKSEFLETIKLKEFINKV